MSIKERLKEALSLLEEAQSKLDNICFGLEDLGRNEEVTSIEAIANKLTPIINILDDIIDDTNDEK